jgi:Pentapeptide repeats (8 copies)
MNSRRAGAAGGRGGARQQRRQRREQRRLDLLLAASWLVGGAFLWLLAARVSPYMGLMLAVALGALSLAFCLAVQGSRRRKAPGLQEGEGTRIEIRDLFTGDLLTSVEGGTLAGAELSGTNLSWANLRGANLRQARLRGASLASADLEGADLQGADLEGANLTRANLEGANLAGADLAAADLRSATLQHASLRGADLRGTDLRGAGSHVPANLHRADLTGARYDAATRWPRGFKPARRGCLGPPAEVTPSLAPEGRGNESSPA